MLHRNGGEWHRLAIGGAVGSDRQDDLSIIGCDAASPKFSKDALYGLRPAL
jgi:hypothetical protein